MSRVYPRRFDWDEARRRYEAGDTITAIARDCGVSYTAVRRVVVPGAYEADRAAVARYIAGLKGKGSCRDCGAPIHWNTVVHWGGRCPGCAGLARSTTVRPTTLRGRHPTCRECDAAAKRAWRAANRDAYNKRRARTTA